MDKDSDTKDQRLTEKPEITDEHKKAAKKIADANSGELQSTTLPGSGGTVSGTAVTDWVDDKDKGHMEPLNEEGNVVYRNSEEFRKKLDQ